METLNTIDRDNVRLYLGNAHLERDALDALDRLIDGGTLSAKDCLPICHAWACVKGELRRTVAGVQRLGALLHYSAEA
jgi:hypothetical protein